MKLMHLLRTVRNWLRKRRRAGHPHSDADHVRRNLLGVFAITMAGPLRAAQDASFVPTDTLRALRSKIVPRDRNVVMVSGVDAVGDAGAGMILVRDPMISATQVSRNPATSFVDSAGARFRRAGSLWGFRQPISEALVRMGEGKIAEQVSWLDFLPYEKHASILDHSSTDDLSEPLQAMLNALPSGARVYVPGRINIERGLKAAKSITLYGDPGRENFDNSWDYSTGGSQIIFRGARGDVLTFDPPEDDGRTMNVVLRDFIVRGNRKHDNGRENNAAVSGRGIVFRGGEGHATNVRVDIDNVHVCQAADEGVVLARTTFGGSLRNMFLHRNGRSGFATSGLGGVGIGEMWLARLRIFQNGQRGDTLASSAGFAWEAGSFLATQLSCSENAGPGAVIAGGPFEINMMQVESNGLHASLPAQRRQIVLGSPRMGIVSARISALSSTPPDACEGAHIELLEHTKNIVLSGYMGGSLGKGGRHIVRRADSEQLDIRNLGGVSIIHDQSFDHNTSLVCKIVARQQAMLRAVTGDGKTEIVWAPDTLLINPQLGSYDVETGTFTAPVAAMFHVSVEIPLIGIGPSHSACTLLLAADTLAREIVIGNAAALREPQTSAYNLRFAGDVPLRQGQRLQVRYRVSGGQRTVGVAPGTGIISIRAC